MHSVCFAQAIGEHEIKTKRWVIGIDSKLLFDPVNPVFDIVAMHVKRICRN